MYNKCVDSLLPVSIYVNLLKSIKIFQSYDHRCTAAFFVAHSVCELVKAEMPTFPLLVEFSRFITGFLPSRAEMMKFRFLQTFLPKFHVSACKQQRLIILMNVNKWPIFD